MAGKVNIQDIEDRLWDAADELRANSGLGFLAAASAALPGIFDLQAAAQAATIAGAAVIISTLIVVAVRLVEADLRCRTAVTVAQETARAEAIKALLENFADAASVTGKTPVLAASDITEVSLLLALGAASRPRAQVETPGNSPQEVVGARYISGTGVELHLEQGPWVSLTQVIAIHTVE